ncbi:hypothetical protein [Nocardioides koreensis]|uniref:hypothetical protein n=1 Tax=Nocardioides koreensis TaxID=433651 RepID=UPI0031E47CC5
MAPTRTGSPGHGGIAGAVFGDSTSWLSWHWRESAAGLAIATPVVGLVTWVRRRRRAGA